MRILMTGVLALLILLAAVPVLAQNADSGFASGNTLLTDSSLEALADTLGQDTVAIAGAAADAEGKIQYPMDPERKAKLISYSRFVNIWRFVSFFVSIGVLLLILSTGLSAKLRDWASVAKKRFFVIWLYLALFLVVEYLLNFPFDFYRGFIVESDYGFLNQSFLSWWREDILGLLVGIVVGVIPVWFLYLVINRVKRWWLAFSIGAIPFAVLAIVVAPVLISPLFNDFEPVKDKQLEAKLLALAEKAGIEGSDVFQVDASKQSSKINAYVTGLFGTKRIVLYDTMIKNFSHDEIMFVMGHEMGHYVMDHLFWGLGVAILFILLMTWLTDKTVHPIIRRYQNRFGFSRLGDIASLPLLLIFLTVFQFVFQPVTNNASRYMERQSDVFGMEVTDVSGETAARAFDKLSVFNLSDPDPHPVIEFWFYSHPALNKRMAFVRGYAQELGR